MSEDCNFDIIPGNYLEIYSIAKALCLHYRNIGYEQPITAINIQFSDEGNLDEFDCLYDEVIRPLHNGEGIKDQFEDA